MRRKGFISRADLAETLSKVDDDLRETAAELLGFVYRRRPRPQLTPEFLLPIDVQASNEAPAPAEQDVVSGPVAPSTFWRLEKYESRGNPPLVEPPPLVKPEWLNRPAEPPKCQWAVSWRSLWPRLFAALGVEQPGVECDIDKAVELVSRNECVDALPKKTGVLPLAKIQIVVDRSAHLIPYWFDWDIIARLLAQHFGCRVVELAITRETADDRCFAEMKEGEAIYRLPPRGAAVVAFTDMGVLTGDSWREKSWVRFGRQIRNAGCTPIVLSPSPAGLVPKKLRRLWRLIEWEDYHGEPTLDRAQRHAQARRLLALASHAFRIEPELLRALRLSLGREGGDLGVEAEAWMQLAMQHVSAGTMDSGFAAELHGEFDREDSAVKQRALALQRHWRHDVASEIWFDEIVNLPQAARELLPEPEDLGHARRFFAFAGGIVNGGHNLSESTRSWLAHKVARRATADAWAVPEFARALYEVKKSDLDFELPGSVDPAVLEGRSRLEGSVCFGLGKERLLIRQRPAAEDGEGVWSPHLGALPSENGVLNCSTVADPRPDPRPDPALFWSDREAPSWVSGWGEDEFGAWAEFEIGDVAQRLRWIPPGRFMMGSPEGEAGRFDNEGPCHEVTFGAGFWMMDTPVRQCLWQVVMGENPSRFKGAERPVENVSWSKAQKFLSRLNGKVSGLELALPSEAQWEYACRAGSVGATYAEDLDSIAWWSGNSQGQIRPVAQKQANDFGLFDMLGNVWEWCADQWHENYEGAPTDGSAWIDGDANAPLRALRGGSWYGSARGVRSAYRVAYTPDNRYGDIGFRCARVHASDKQGAAAPSDREAGRLAERRAAARSLGEAAAVRLTPETPTASAPLPLVGRLRIKSDSAELEFARIGRPIWASAMGCDLHGLFAEFKIDEVVQRLRWIPPGRFWMGSPKDENGRLDSEGPRHQVTLGSGFWMMDTPVRQSLWQAVMGSNPSKFTGLDRPVENVDWNRAQQFLSRLNGRIAGLELTLPSEAQWEYACRAGREAATYAEELDRIAWYWENSEGQTHPVGQKLPNGYGLYDMLGNVWEWCADHWHENYEGAPSDGSVWVDSGDAALRVVRGGSWSVGTWLVRVAYRDGGVPSDRLGDLGFRCVRVQS